MAHSEKSALRKVLVVKSIRGEKSARQKVRKANNSARDQNSCSKNSGGKIT